MRARLAESAQLMAIIAEGNRAKLYLPPIAVHECIANEAIPHDVPDTDLPEKALGFRVQRYGMTKHRHLFTPRQLVGLTTLSNLVRQVRDKICADAGGGKNAEEYADAVCTFLAFAVDRCADFGTALPVDCW